MTRRVLVTPRSLTAAGLDTIAGLAPLRDAGFATVPGPAGRIPTEQELLALVPGCVGWLAGIEPIGARVLAAATALRVISRNGSGTDAIDTDAAARAGIRVVRAEGANAQGVAELAIALALAGLRHVPWSAAALRAGRWDRHRGRELDECRVGVVGLGAIGGRVARLFRTLGADVVATDPVVHPTTAPVPLVDLDALLASCDVVTLHTPPAADGRPLLGADRLVRVRRGAVLVNTARAALVDDATVLAALEDGRLAAYAVDAFDTEPPPLTPLLRHDRVVATPHVGGFTGASVRRATAQAVENMLAVLAEVRT